jgi:hypothetical protein
MPRREIGGGLGVLGVALTLFACTRDKGSPATCIDFTAPGVVVALPGLQATLRTNQGQAAALGASMTATASNGAAISGYVLDSLTMDAYVTAGTYTVKITKPAYRDTTIANLVVLPDLCGRPLTTKISIALQPLSGAASVRSVGVTGAEFLATPRSQAHLVAFVDADSGISRAVTWQLSDPALATIDQRGVVTAKCSAHGGNERATATSVANRGLSGSVTFGIGANEGC